MSDASMDQGLVRSNEDISPVCCGEKEADVKGTALYLLVRLHSNP